MNIVQAKTLLREGIGHELEQRHRQRVDIRALVGLCFAVLFRRRVAGRSKQLCILRTHVTKEASDAEINEFDTAIAHEHNIAWLHIAENDRWLLAVQIAQYVAQLLCPP